MAHQPTKIARLTAGRRRRLAVVRTLRAWRTSVKNGRPITDANLRRLLLRQLASTGAGQ